MNGIRIQMGRAIGVWALWLSASISLSGCYNDHYLLAATATVIGVEVSQNPATQTPQAKIGYNRGELAYVPTNRVECKDKDGITIANCSAGGGARDSAEVLMEIAFDAQTGKDVGAGVYQRLAVGPEAVRQPGAAFMMARAADGTLQPDTALAVTNAYLGGVAMKGRIDAFTDEIFKSGQFDSARFIRIVETAYPAATHEEANTLLKGVVIEVGKFADNQKKIRFRQLLQYYDRYVNRLTLTSVAVQ